METRGLLSLVIAVSSLALVNSGKKEPSPVIIDNSLGDCFPLTGEQEYSDTFQSDDKPIPLFCSSAVTDNITEFEAKK